jgi:hypothetical protein
MTTDEMLAKVELLYEGRKNGDQSRFGEVLTQDAIFT